MQFRHLLAGLGALFLLGGLAHAQPSGISQKVGVCDVKTPTNCVKPNADGSINISGSITASNPSVGTNNATAPTSSTQIGVLDGGGKLQPASASNPVPVTGSFAAGYTAAASPTAVSAGPNKPGYIDTANSAQFFEPVKPGTTTAIDLSAPSGILGADGATIMSPSNPVSTGPSVVATTDRSGSLTTGGTAQAAIALNTSRKGWCVQNPPTATENLSVRVNGTASATTGTSLAPGQQACNQAGLIDTAAVSVFAATTSHAFTAFEVQ